jgi:hypothetical protein
MWLSQHLEGYLLPLREAFSRERTFQYFVLVVWGLILCLEKFAGVTSLVRCFALAGEPCYRLLLHFFHSKAFRSERLARCWTKSLLAHPRRYNLNGRPLFIGDGIKVPKEGRKMPGVKLHHQESDDNSKREYIFGHYYSGVALALEHLGRIVAVPLRLALHDGFRTARRKKDEPSTIDKMASLLVMLAGDVKSYFCLDAFYPSHKAIALFLHHGHHLISRMKGNASAYYPAAPTSDRKGPGRPPKYGEKVKLALFFGQPECFQAVAITTNDHTRQVRLRAVDLYWLGFLVRFVFVIDDHDGSRYILLSTDTTLAPQAIAWAYLLRGSIELSFKSLVHSLHAFGYHFWLRRLPPDSRKKGNLRLDRRRDDELRLKVARKVRAYENFLSCGTIALATLQLLSIDQPEKVWKTFPLWFRTLPGAERLPSDLVVKYALQHEVARIMASSPDSLFLGKFLAVLPRDTRERHPLQYAAGYG